MRLPFPERIPFLYGLIFASGLCIVQLLEGTSGLFALACFFFIILSVLTFNQAGGFSRCSGAFVFFYALLTVTIGITWKAILGEPADSNLGTPLPIIYAFLGTMCGMFVAVVISQKLIPGRPLLEKVSIDDSKMPTVIVGCLVTGIGLSLLINYSSLGDGSVLSALNQLNRFGLMAIILGVTYTIRQSGGRRSLSLPVILAMVYAFVQGVFGFSKEGMLSPFACWFIAAASQRYYVSRAQMLAILLMVFCIFHYLVPYSQYGRSQRAETFSQNVQVVYFLMTHLEYVRQQYTEQSLDQVEGNDNIPHYYNTPQGFFDRLQAIAMDGAIITHTLQFGTYGYIPVIHSFENLVPHFIWKDKPYFASGNDFAHELGIIPDEDLSTGVSFSATGEAFHVGGWGGIFLLAPAIFIFLFTIFDTLCGDVRKSIWGLLATSVFVHVAPEGGIDGLVYATGYITTGIAFVAVVSYYVMPIVGSLITGPNKQRGLSDPPPRPLSFRSSSN